MELTTYKSINPIPCDLLRKPITQASLLVRVSGQAARKTVLRKVQV